jgi:hypothetical protein
MALQPFVGPWPLFQFLELLHSHQDSLDGGSARRKAAIYTGEHKQNKRRGTSMTRVGFEPMIAVSERAKKILALDCAATLIGV